MPVYKQVFFSTIIFALFCSLSGCNLGVSAPGEPGFEEPFFEEPHMEDPDMGEPHPEESEFMEPHPEEHPPEEPHMEEPHPEEPPQEEPPAQQPQQPQSQQQQQSSSGPWTTDIAVTDIYPGKQPHGQFHMRITNHGPGTLKNVQVGVSCSSERTDKNTGQLSSGGNANFNVSLSLKPGKTKAFATSLSLDTTVFDYLVGCEVHPGFNDPNPGNNVYSETLK